MDFCSKFYAFFASIVKTREVSVEKTDLDSSVHDFELTKNVCVSTSEDPSPCEESRPCSSFCSCEQPCSCEDSCPCKKTNSVKEEKKISDDFSEIREKVDEVLQLFETQLLEEAMFE